MAEKEPRFPKKQGISLWLAENWRSLAFVTYMVICLFDFVIMPLLFQMFNQHIDATTLVQLAQQFKDPEAQRQFIQTFGTRLVWVPLTTQGASSFHVAFGALLTAAGWTRGQAEVAAIQNPVIVQPPAPNPQPAPPPAPVPDKPAC